MNALQKWMAKATPAEKVRIARLAGMSRSTLQWVAGAYRTKGKINLGPEAARILARAGEQMQREGLPPLKREALCAACGRCEYVKGGKHE